ncbi:MAG: hypothetical protein BGO07_02595 [Alphaproteobacteria bacterium 40-19]|nr:MAG: hypothetical protein BGO07_02595 [Alphaproteobacteria bacterium 40-19]
MIDDIHIFFNKKCFAFIIFLDLNKNDDKKYKMVGGGCISPTVCSCFIYKKIRSERTGHFNNTE